MTATVTVKTTTSVVRDEAVAELDKSAEALIVEFNEAKAALKVLEGRKAAAEKALREMLGAADVGMIDGVERVRVSHRNRSNIDRELLKSAFPEAYEATQTETAYTVLTTK